MRFIIKSLTDLPKSLKDPSNLKDLEIIAKKADKNKIKDSVYRDSYKHPDGNRSHVVDKLNEFYNYKCAYCERVCKADAEHYRPKKSVTGTDHPGYYWLCYEWTSGVHLYWWSRRRLSHIPEVQVTDLRSVGATQLSRQIDLTSWSLVMLRLTFIEDIITYARCEGDPLGKISSLTEQAALSLNTFNLNNLAKWIKSEAIPQLDAQLSKNRYVELANQLHSERTGAEAQQNAALDGDSAGDSSPPES